MSRGLAAMLAADIVGYSKLVGADEAAALGALRDLRTNQVRPFAAQHRGEIVKSMGDGWLIAFNSAQDAVSFAIKLQDALENHKSIKIRIGVHIGDVTREDENIFGDGVNVAARLEALAPRGGAALAATTIAKPSGFPRLTGQPVATTDDRGEVRDLAEGLTADISLYLAAIHWIDTGEGYTLTQTLRTRGDRLRL